MFYGSAVALSPLSTAICLIPYILTLIHSPYIATNHYIKIYCYLLFLRKKKFGSFLAVIYSYKNIKLFRFTKSEIAFYDANFVVGWQSRKRPFVYAWLDIFLLICFLGEFASVCVTILSIKNPFFFLLGIRKIGRAHV